MLPRVELAKTRDFSETINDTFLFVRQNLKPLVKYYFTFCGFFIAAGAISGVLYQLKANRVLSQMVSATNNMEYKPNIFQAYGTELFLTITFSLLTYITIEVTTISYVALYKEKDKQIPTSEEMWGYIKYFYLRTAGTYFLLIILLFVAFLFCVIPSFYLAPIFALVLPIMIIENTSFGYAFSRCFVLIKENWWSTFGAIVIIWIIVYVGMVIVTLPGTVITLVATLLHPQSSTSLAIPAAAVTVVLRQICLMFAMIPAITVCLCYFNLTESKDGTSLLNRINKLGNISPDSDLPVEEY